MHPYIHAVHPSIPTYLHTIPHTYRHTDMQTHRHADIQTHRHTDIHTYGHSGIHTFTHTQTHTHMCVYIIVRTYTHYTVHIHMHWHLHILHFYIHPYVRLSTTVPKHLSPGTCIATSSLWLWTLKALNWIVTGLCAWCKCILDDLSCRRIASYPLGRLLLASGIEVFGS